MGSNKTNTAIDAEFDDFKADVVDCWGKLTAEDRIKLEGNLPRYDKDWNGNENGRRAFYNACYYSYSCCTEGNLGGFTKKDLMEDNGLPTTKVQKFAREFKKWEATAKKTGVKASCWKRFGAQDPRMNKYVQNCWDAISWCNLLCPRDDDDTVDEKMCKECINLGFQREAPRRFVNGHTSKEIRDKYGRISGLSTKFAGKGKGELNKAEESLEREIGKNANDKNAAKF